MTALALLVLTATVTDHPHPSCAIDLIRSPCTLDFVDVDAIEQLLCIELESSVRTASTSVDATSALSISFFDTPCTPETTQLSVHIDAGAELEPEQLSIPLADVAPVLRPRTAALLILENLRALRVAQPPEKKESPIAEHRSPLTLFAAGNARYFPRYSSMLFGTGAGVGFSIAERIELDAELGAALGSKRTSLGVIDLRVLSLALLVRYRVEPANALALLFGARLESGYAWARGHAESAETIERSTSNATLVGALTAMVRVAMSARFELFVEPELGAAIYGFDTRADGVRGNGISGWIAKLSFGARFRL
jgi:hypothetical protein